jgi:uncharacterized protein (TIGR03000 family)
MPKKAEGPGSTTAVAQMIVELPQAEVKLYVDDQLMKTGGSKRTFNTPRLEPGQAYYYDVRAEIDRGSAKVTRSKRVIVRAGEVVQIAFPEVKEQTPVNVASAGR